MNHNKILSHWSEGDEYNNSAIGTRNYDKNTSENQGLGTADRKGDTSRKKK